MCVCASAHVPHAPASGLPSDQFPGLAAPPRFTQRHGPSSPTTTCLGVIEVASFHEFSANQKALLEELLPVTAMSLEILSRNIATQRVVGADSGAGTPVGRTERGRQGARSPRRDALRNRRGSRPVAGFRRHDADVRRGGPERRRRRLHAHLDEGTGFRRPGSFHECRPLYELDGLARAGKDGRTKTRPHRGLSQAARDQLDRRGSGRGHRLGEVRGDDLVRRLSPRRAGSAGGGDRDIRAPPPLASRVQGAGRGGGPYQPRHPAAADRRRTSGRQR